MSFLRIPLAVGSLVLHLNLAFSQAVQNGEPSSAVAALTGIKVHGLALRLDGVPSVPISEINRELERRGVGLILERPYDQNKIDKAREIILDLYRRLVTGPVGVTSYARRVSKGTVEVVFVIHANAERAGNSD